MKLKSAILVGLSVIMLIGHTPASAGTVSQPEQQNTSTASDCLNPSQSLIGTSILLSQLNSQKNLPLSYPVLNSNLNIQSGDIAAQNISISRNLSFRTPLGLFGTVVTVGVAVDHFTRPTPSSQHCLGIWQERLSQASQLPPEILEGIQNELTGFINSPLINSPLINNSTANMVVCQDSKKCDDELAQNRLRLIEALKPLLAQVIANQLVTSSALVQKNLLDDTSTPFGGKIDVLLEGKWRKIVGSATLQMLFVRHEDKNISVRLIKPYLDNVVVQESQLLSLYPSLRDSIESVISPIAITSSLPPEEPKDKRSELCGDEDQVPETNDIESDTLAIIPRTHQTAKNVFGKDYENNPQKYWAGLHRGYDKFSARNAKLWSSYSPEFKYQDELKTFVQRQNGINHKTIVGHSKKGDDGGRVLMLLDGTGVPFNVIDEWATEAGTKVAKVSCFSNQCNITGSITLDDAYNILEERDEIARLLHRLELRTFLGIEEDLTSYQLLDSACEYCNNTVMSTLIQLYDKFCKNGSFKKLEEMIDAIDEFQSAINDLRDVLSDPALREVPLTKVTSVITRLKDIDAITLLEHGELMTYLTRLIEQDPIDHQQLSHINLLSLQIPSPEQLQRKANIEACQEDYICRTYFAQYNRPLEFTVIFISPPEE